MSSSLMWLGGLELNCRSCWCILELDLGEFPSSLHQLEKMSFHLTHFGSVGEMWKPEASSSGHSFQLTSSIHA